MRLSDWSAVVLPEIGKVEHTEEALCMRLFVVRYLLIDDWLHAATTLTPLQALAEKGVDVTCVFPVKRAAPENLIEHFRIEAVHLPRVLPILSYLWFLRVFGHFFSSGGKMLTGWLWKRPTHLYLLRPYCGPP